MSKKKQKPKSSNRVKNSKTQTEPKRNAAVAAVDALKEVALRTLLVGKFYQFGVIGVFGLLAWKLDSPDIVKLAELFAESYVYNVLGWVLFVASSAAYTVFGVQQRKFYQGEIKRLSSERTKQQQGNGTKFIGTDDLKGIGENND